MARETDHVLAREDPVAMPRCRGRCVLIAVLSIGLATACATPQRPISAEPVVHVETQPVSAAELRVSLTRYTDRLVFLLDQSTQAIKEATDDVSRKRLVLAWKIQMATFIRQTMALREPGEALIDLWAFVIQLDHLFRLVAPPAPQPVMDETPRKDRAALLSSSPVPARNAREALAQIDDLARRVITVKDFARVRAALVDFAERHPLIDMEGPETPEINLISRPVDDASFHGILALLTTPARVFLDDTAEAIEGFSRTGEKFAEIIKLVPEQFSWRMEMIAYDLEHGDTAVATRRNLNLFSSSSEQAVARIAALPNDLQVLLDRAIERLPTKVREEAVRGVEELLERREQLDQTLEKLRQTLASAESVTQHSGVAATQIAQAGEAWKGAFGELRGMVDDARKDDAPAEETSSHPFDVREYGTAAHEITLAGHSLRAAVTEARALIADSQSLEATIARTRGELERSIEHTRSGLDRTVRHWIYLAGAVAAGLMLLGFALVLLLRITRPRLASGSATPTLAPPAPPAGS